MYPCRGAMLVEATNQHHLWEGTWKSSFLLEGPPVSCHVSWREGRLS